MPPLSNAYYSFFFNDTATTEIYTLSLHDALPILENPSTKRRTRISSNGMPACLASRDRKSTRLNSSHVRISYAVFCLKKKKNGLFFPYPKYSVHPSASVHQYHLHWQYIQAHHIFF